MGLQGVRNSMLGDVEMDLGLILGQAKFNVHTNSLLL